MGADILIGFGEVGSALYEVLSERREVGIMDPAKGANPEPGESVEWMHVAIPYSDKFVTSVLDYVKMFKPLNLVIHSTVKVGTSREIANDVPSECMVYYSPIRGIHPNLATYIRQFPKWFASQIAMQDTTQFEEYFASAGVQTRKVASMELLEWLKLVETFEYGYRIVQWQELDRELDKIPLGKMGKDYAMTALREWLFEKRKVYEGDRGLAPIMYSGPILGHCVTQNWELLKELMTPELYAWLTTSNELRKEK